MRKNKYTSPLYQATSRLTQIVLLALALTACVNDEYVGGEDINGTPVSFSTNTGGGTRAAGAEAATLLGNSFVVYGSKKLSETETQTVFSGYKVDYTPNTANTTESNTNGWEYVGLTSPTAGIGPQTIKYWDHSASSYTFGAYSLGKGDDTTTPATHATPTTVFSNALLNSITLQGTAPQLTSCYYTDKQKVTSTNYRQAVQLQFRNLAANIRLGLYETIPGYSVKDVQFYALSGDASPDTEAKLYTTTAAPALPGADGGTYTITYNDEGKAQIAFTPAEAVAPATTTLTNLLSLGQLQAETFANNQVDEAAEQVYLGRSSNASTITIYNKVLPYNAGADLHLKVDYTLLSLDGSGQCINVKGATAIVPAAYANWKCNYAYTYIFKISDNTNGYTGGDGNPAGLYPITFDAWAMSSDEEQGTITTFSTYSITTTQGDDVHGDGVSYKTGKPIDITVIKGDGSEAEKIVLGNASPKTDWVRIILQDSNNEEDVEQTYPDGKEVTSITYVDGVATFTPADEGYYRVEYWHQGDDGAQKLSVKIVKVGSPKGDGSIKASKDEWDQNYRKAPRRPDNSMDR